MIDTILTVFKTGGDYDWRYVENLFNAVDRHLKREVRYVVLTDSIEETTGCSVPNMTSIKLQHDLPGWWSKVEMWRPDIQDMLGRTLFLDLDTLIVGDITNICKWEDQYDGVMITKDWWHDCPSQSILMFNPGNCSMLWDRFWADPKRIMANGDRMIAPNFGDQILFNTGDVPPYKFIQDEFPGQVGSYKATFHKKAPTPGHNVRIVCFHGRPRPHVAAETDPWVAENWK